MRYFLCNYLGVTGHWSWSRDEVIDSMSSRYWPMMKSFYLPETEVWHDGIRYTYGGFPVNKIQSLEDLERFEKEYTGR